MKLHLGETLKRLRAPAYTDAPEMDIREIVRAADDFRVKLEQVKAGMGRVDFAWYPYDSLSNFWHLKNVLTGERRRLLRLAQGRPVLDVGPGDGACSFLLEALGLAVHALENPATSHNGLRGIRRLKQALGSSVEIFAEDVDRCGVYPSAGYGLTLFCGILYHLKNPVHALETLAGATEYCVLSTRLARVSPDRQTRFEHLPMAYLLDEAEANDDGTNYWIFSEVGLKRLLRRTGWDVLDYATVASTPDSDPVSEAGDERAFCLLRSRAVAAVPGVQFLSGWHAVEHGAWRWTARRFAVRVSAAPAAETLQFRFFLPAVVSEKVGPVTLSARVNGVAMPPVTYDYPGDH
ncbi:MAG: class I SAM-dependent methyltransferase [Acidobacteria bacterium]|nr:class I SAM-dependent methyltransferase [Acidobacteriota bacterium]